MIIGMDATSTAVCRAPSVVLGVVLVVCGLVTLPLVALLVVAFVHRGGENPAEFWTGALPALLGYPLVAALWWRSRRNGGNWPLTVLGIAVIVAVSWLPLYEFAVVAHLQWLETQPGGRGYQ
jgi:hypothetical protein